MERLGRMRWLALWAAAAVLFFPAVSCKKRSSSVPLGTVQEIRVSPGAVLLKDVAATVQLVVTGITDTGRTVDLTPSSEGTTYTTADPTVARVTLEGVVYPQGPGTTTLMASNATFTDTTEVYSDWAPPLMEGDFDLRVPDVPVLRGSSVTILLVLETGGKTFGSYRARITYDPDQFDLVGVAPGAGLGFPMAVRKDVAGEVEILDTYTPGTGQVLSGSIETARIVLRVKGDAGQASIITGEALGVSDDSFPSAPIGASTPRGFATGRRWLVIAE